MGVSPSSLKPTPISSIKQDYYLIAPKPNNQSLHNMVSFITTIRQHPIPIHQLENTSIKTQHSTHIIPSTLLPLQPLRYLLKFIHKSLFSPTIRILTTATKLNFLNSIPSLTYENIHKHLCDSTETIIVHSCQSHSHF